MKARSARPFRSCWRSAPGGAVGLIPQLAAPGDRRNVPDGTVRDENSLPRGYWEAKDSGDDLRAEIAKKIARATLRAPTTASHARFQR